MTAVENKLLCCAWARAAVEQKHAYIVCLRNARIMRVVIAMS